MDESKRVDQTIPSGKWEFDAGVTGVFDDMLERSIPQYHVMREAVTSIGLRYVAIQGAGIVDLGCSRGGALAPFVSFYGDNINYYGVEVSDPMIDASRERFHELIKSGKMQIEKLDLRREYPNVKSSLTLSVLTLQFIPIEYRQKIVRNIYDNLVPGGALILVEKILGDTANIDELMVETYYNEKRRNGYSEEQIQRKRLSLEGVLVPITAGWNEHLLRAAGFREVDCFWRWMNFAGWVAVK